MASSGEERIVPLNELNKHNNEKDCWVAIHGKVYNITAFLVDHPGGPDTILEHAGAECTEAFEDTGHSTSARNMMGKYLVGSLAGAEKTSGKEGNASTGAAKQNIPAEHGGSPLAYAIPILILLGVLYYQFVFLPKGKEHQAL